LWSDRRAGSQQRAQAVFDEGRAAYRASGFSDLDELAAVQFVNRPLENAYAVFSVGRGYGPEISVGHQLFGESLAMKRLHMAHELAHALQFRKMVRAMGEEAARVQIGRVGGLFLNMENAAFDIRYNPLYFLREVQAESLAQQVIRSRFALSWWARRRSNAYIAQARSDLREVLAGLWD
jgi:hypothetical protein